MRKFIFILFIFILCGCLNSKSPTKEPSLYYTLPEVQESNLDTSLEGNNHLYPIEIDGLYGFIDINGKMIIEPKFTTYEMLEKGYYLATTVDENYVLNEEKYVDPTNATYLISPNNKEIKLSDGYASMYLSNDKTRAIVYEESANYIFDMVSQEKLIESDEAYSILAPYGDFYVRSVSNSHYMTDYNGKNLSEGYEYYEGSIEDTVFFKDNGTTYWLDKSGNSFFKYDNCMLALPFHDEIAPIIDNDMNLIFVDKNGRVQNSYEGFFSVYREGNIYYGYKEEDIEIFSLNGEVKSFDENMGNILLRDYSNKNNLITSYNKSTSTFYVFDENGDIKQSLELPEGFSSASLIYDDYVKLQSAEACGIGSIEDGKIKWIIEPKYSDLYAENPYILIYANKNFTYGLYDITNKKYILEPNYTHIVVFNENMVYVESAYFKGYVNSNGQFVYITPSYGFVGGD